MRRYLLSKHPCVGTGRDVYSRPPLGQQCKHCLHLTVARLVLSRWLQPDTQLRIKLKEASPTNATVQICYGVGTTPCGERLPALAGRGGGRWMTNGHAAWPLGTRALHTHMHTCASAHEHTHCQSPFSQTWSQPRSPSFSSWFQRPCLRPALRSAPVSLGNAFAMAGSSAVSPRL